MRTLLLTTSILALVACGADVTGPAETAPAPEAAPVAAPADADTESADVDYPDAGVYEMDPNHTSITWTVRHQGLSNYTARFNTFDIKLTLDPDDEAANTVDVTIDPTSIDPNYPGDYLEYHSATGFSSWQEDLALSDNWFNGDEFPEITFVGTNFAKTGPNTGRVTGDLTLVGVTKPVVLDVTFNGVNRSDSGDKVGFSAVASLKRSDFGITALSAFVGDDVTVYIESEFKEVTQ